MAGIAPKLMPPLLDRWRPSGRTPFEKYKEEVGLIVRASPIVREWAAKRGPAVDVVAAVQQLGANGMRRMPDSRVVRLAVISGRMLGGLSDEECTRLAEGKGSPHDQEKLFAPLADPGHEFRCRRREACGWTEERGGVAPPAVPDACPRCGRDTVYSRPIPRKVRFHDLRHSFGTAVVAAGGTGAGQALLAHSARA